MKYITEMQKSSQTVHVIPAKAAEPLLKDGLVRRATIDPAPKDGEVAVNLTAKGRGYKQSAQPTEASK